jgi:ubiquinone biosynthesis UbiH/UbiF/VisC/COQ6 family hydroxylase
MHGEAVESSDVLIIGAGPAGLALATALADAGLSITLIERQPRGALAEPQADGREIALTHRSRQILESLGLWQRFAADEVAPLRQARVVDGTSAQALWFDARGSDKSELGYLVANHVIRRAAFAAARERAAVRLVVAANVAAVSAGPARAAVRLGDGRVFQAALVVAADSRFSETRRRMGIGADQRDFGRTVIVCRLAHEHPNRGIAHECFRYGNTLAILPLNGNQVSAVLTLPSDRADAPMQMNPDGFAALVQEQFGGRLGAMQLVGERHRYPLVAVYAHRFVAPRFALLGDAAVGMHPVTAHGYNFGLYGVDALTRRLRGGRALKHDLGALDVLAGYEAEHRRATLPIYLGTNAIVRLFTDERAPARALRTAVLRAADLVAPLKSIVTRQLTGTPLAPLGPLR